MLDQRQTADPKPLARQTSPFPSASFDFALSGYEGLFGLAGSGVAGPELPFHTDEKVQDSIPFPGSTRSSISVPYSPVESPTVGNDGIAPSLHAVPSSESIQQLLPFIYPSYDPSSGFAQQQQFTHVDPTQLLGVDRDAGQNQNYHPSPSSDGWGGGGFNSSSTASPEPYVSNSSTPPSTESGGSAGASTARTVTGRKVNGGLRQIEPGRGTGNVVPAQKKKGGPTIAAAPRQAALRSPSSPDLAQNAASSSANQGSGADDADSSPTVCTNCQTRNTPLWRRDPEGQPLCESFADFQSFPASSGFSISAIVAD